MRTLTKREALAIFRKEVLPGIRKQYEMGGKVDIPARCEAWNNFTDELFRSRKISAMQLASWSNPF